jgi:hypothetical protein
MVHRGLFYSFHVVFPAVAAAATRNVVVRTMPDCGTLHLREVGLWTDQDEATYELFENPESAVGGTPVPFRNRNRNRPDSDGCALVHTATINLTGAALLEVIKFGGGGSGGLRVGGSRYVEREWVLPPGRTYIMRITNNAPSAADINMYGYFYKQPME